MVSLPTNSTTFDAPQWFRSSWLCPCLSSPRPKHSQDPIISTRRLQHRHRHLPAVTANRAAVKAATLSSPSSKLHNSSIVSPLFTFSPYPDPQFGPLCNVKDNPPDECSFLLIPSINTWPGFLPSSNTTTTFLPAFLAVTQRQPTPAVPTKPPRLETNCSIELDQPTTFL